MSFPQQPLDLRCDLNLGGTWTDITSYAYQREGTSPPISIQRGRPDETSQAQASSAAFELNNRDGRFSPKNAASPYYGLLGRNTGVRWSVPAQSNYLRLENDAVSYASCPPSTGNSITGDLDIQLQLGLTDWRNTLLASKWNSGSNYRSWVLVLNGSGTIGMVWTPDGTTLHNGTSQLPLPYGTGAVRVTLSVATATTAFYTASSIAGPWTQLGPFMTQGAATSVFGGGTSSAPVVIGYNSAFSESWFNGGATPASMYGAVSEFRLYSGIGGTLKAAPVFSAQSAGTTSFTDAQGNAWTLHGTAEISSRNYRYHGEMSSLPGKWDASGKDISVPVTAGGLLRRIGQGQAPTMSAMKRGLLLAAPGLEAYWPCEDGKAATQLSSAIGGPPMVIAGTPSLSSDSSFACSAPIPSTGGAVWEGNVPTYASTNNLICRFLLKLGSNLPAAQTAMVRVITSGTIGNLDFNIYPAYGVGLAGGGTFSSGALNFNPDSPTGTLQSQQCWVSMELAQSGSTVTWSLIILFIGGAAYYQSGSYSGSIGIAQQVIVNGAAGTDAVIGHISVQSEYQNLFGLFGPVTAWNGEAAASRFARLCSENSLNARITGPPATSAAMGPQAVDTLNNLLQSCEDADRGQVYEPREALALGYRTYASQCQQAPVVSADYSLAQLGAGGTAGLEPAYDDQFVRNDVTLSRQAGSASGGTFQYQLADGSAMSISEPPAGIGDYSDSLTVTCQLDTQLPDIAAWMVHIGSTDQMRWPAVPWNLARTVIAGTSLYWQLLSADIGDCAAIANLPGQITADPVKQLVSGTEEKLGGLHYTVTWHAVPESPWEVAVLSDPVYGRADTDGSALAAAVTSTATTLSVATTGPSGILWTTVAGDFPFDIGIAGERITVTGISGSSSPQSFSVTRSVNGVSKSQASGAAVSLWYPPYLAIL